MRVRIARRGEGKDVAELAVIALRGRPSAGAEGDLAQAVDSGGGRVPVPYGPAHVLVADAGEGLAGMLYATPCIRLAEEHAEKGPYGQELIARRLAEVELLAVTPGQQGRGVGRHLVTTAGQMLLQRGVRALLAKVLLSDEDVAGWYARRGFEVLSAEQLLVLRVAPGIEVGVSGASEDGYRIAVKRLS